MTDTVRVYLHQIGLVGLLTAQEERELSQVIEKGRDAAVAIENGERSTPELRRAIKQAAASKDRFIRANLRLVVSVARRYPLPPGMELLDLIQEGNLGLEHAVDKFDWRKGFKFSTYATFWIRQAIGRALDKKATMVRLPVDRAASLRAALRHANGDGDELDEDLARLYRLTTPTSLDRLIGDGGSSELVEVVPDSLPGPEEAVMDRVDKQLVADMLAALEPRGRSAVWLYFGLDGVEGRTFADVARLLGLTPDATRATVRSALGRLRQMSADDLGVA